MAEDAGIVVARNAAVLSEFAGIVSTLAEELLAPHPRVIRWRVVITHGEVALEVSYTRGRGVVPGRAWWTLAGILNDGAAVATRVLHSIRAALDEPDPTSIEAAVDEEMKHLGSPPQDGSW